GLGNARDGDRIGHYREALKLAEEIENKDLQAQALIGLGNVCAASRDNTTALDYFNEALSLVKPGSEFYQKAEEGRDRTQSFLSQRGAGTSSLPSSSSNGQGQKRSYSHVDDSAERDSSSSSQSSLSHGERRSDHQNRAALELAKKSGNKELQAQALIGLGNARDGDRIGHYREALKLAEEIGNKGLQAQALIGLGNARDGNDKEHYRAAFELAKKIGSKELQAQALIGLGNARDGAHNYRVALKLAEEIKNKDLQAQALIGLGNARDGDRIGHYREALKLAEEIKDKDLQAQALIGLGNACAGRRNNQDALTYFEDALSRVNPGSELYKKAEVGRSRAEYFLPVESMKANSQGSSATPSSSKDDPLLQDMQVHLTHQVTQATQDVRAQVLQETADPLQDMQVIREKEITPCHTETPAHADNL
ncbi:MAG: tetratricopeptide repeat protein, partial [Proteobacteria bacterium]|nr:tetratricopeptide repeat protein [Pseudomonadota bacterium]